MFLARSREAEHQDPVNATLTIAKNHQSVAPSSGASTSAWSAAMVPQRAVTTANPQAHHQASSRRETMTANSARPIDNAPAIRT